MNKHIKKLILKTRKQVFGEMMGNNPSLFQGEGFEFAELREYVYGDDVRKIDWKTTAKLGKPFIKIYIQKWGDRKAMCCLLPEFLLLQS